TGDLGFVLEWRRDQRDAGILPRSRNMTAVTGAGCGIGPRCGGRRLGGRQRAGDAFAFGTIRLGEIEIEPGPLRARDRPFVLVAEMIFAMAGADRELDRRFLHHAVVDVLEPVVEEAELVAAALLAVEWMEMRAAVDAQLLVLGCGAHIALGGAA